MFEKALRFHLKVTFPDVHQSLVYVLKSIAISNNNMLREHQMNIQHFRAPSAVLLVVFVYSLAIKSWKTQITSFDIEQKT